MVMDTYERILNKHTCVFISEFNQIEDKICFTISFISCLYMFRAHVLETCRGIK